MGMGMKKEKIFSLVIDRFMKMKDELLFHNGKRIKELNVETLSLAIEKLGLRNFPINKKRFCKYVKLLNKNYEEKMKRKRRWAINFLNGIKNDPQFIVLDTAFKQNQTEENYMNLITYMDRKSEELLFNASLFSYYHRPLYNSSFPSPSFASSSFPSSFPSSFSRHEKDKKDKKDKKHGKNEKNTWVNYMEGNIKFNNKTCYSSIIKTEQTGKTQEHLSKDLTYVITMELGAPSGVTFEFVESGEEEGYFVRFIRFLISKGGVYVLAFIILLVIVVIIIEEYD
jgi:hypothetical protein